MTKRIITVTYDDDDINAERALGLAQITEYNRGFGDGEGSDPFKQMYIPYLSGLCCFCKPKKNGNLSVRVTGRPINPDE